MADKVYAVLIISNEPITIANQREIEEHASHFVTCEHDCVHGMEGICHIVTKPNATEYRVPERTLVATGTSTGMAVIQWFLNLVGDQFDYIPLHKRRRQGKS